MPKEQSEAVNQRKTDNTKVKRKRSKRQTVVDKSLHRKLKIEQHDWIQVFMESVLFIYVFF